MSMNEQRKLAASVAPVVRGFCSNDQFMVGCFDDSAQALQAVASCAGGQAQTGVLVVEPDSAQSPQALEDYFASLESSQVRPCVVAVRGVGVWAFAHSGVAARVKCSSFIKGGRIDVAGADESDKPLAGRVAMVTGGASGIGLACVCRLLHEGASVALVDINAENLARQSEELSQHFSPDSIFTVQCDLSDPDAISAAFDAVCLQWGGMDILVNNAGIGMGKALEDTSAADYDLCNTIMPRGSFLCSKSAAKVLRLQKLGGDIVYVASKNAMFAGPKNVAYGTAKAAQLHQARLVAVELADLNVRVNSVNPDGVVRGSGIFSGGWGAARAKAYGIDENDLGKHYAERTLLKKEILPEDIANAVYVLVGPELRKSTGLIINVDGGFTPTMPR